MKKILLLILIVFISLPLFANGDGEEGAGDTYVIATVPKVAGIAWFERMRQGVEEFAQATGHDAFYIGPAQADATQQVQIVENLIAQGVDAILVVPFSPEALEPVLKRARDQGIVVISHEATSLKNVDYDIEAFVNEEFGAEMMKRLAENMGNEGEYATLVGGLTSVSHKEEIDGAEGYQKSNLPNLSLVSSRSEDYDDQNKAYEITKELLTTYPNLKGIVGAASSTPPGAGLAIEELGLQNKVSVGGVSLPSITSQYLESGAVDFIAFWDPAVAAKAMNKLAVMILDARKAGKEVDVKDGFDLGEEGYTSLKKSSSIDTVLFGQAWVFVTNDNKGDYPF